MDKRKAKLIGHVVQNSDFLTNVFKGTVVGKGIKNFEKKGDVHRIVL